MRAELRNARDEITRIDEERKQLNAEKQDIRSGLKAKGIDIKAFDAAMKRRTLEEHPDLARGWDSTFDLCLGAFGVQTTLALASPDTPASGDE